MDEELCVLWPTAADAKAIAVVMATLMMRETRIVEFMYLVL
ncbi:MAG: hypothetical protein ACLPV8_28195 [Steroidobacteraceae bacterium]